MKSGCSTQKSRPTSRLRLSQVDFRRPALLLTSNSGPYRPESPQLKPHSQKRHGAGVSWRVVGMSWRDAEQFRRLTQWVSPLLLDFLLKVTTPFPKCR